jgi:hypothetical protein
MPRAMSNAVSELPLPPVESLALGSLLLLDESSLPHAARNNNPAAPMAIVRRNPPLVTKRISLSPIRTDPMVGAVDAVFSRLLLASRVCQDC